MNPAVHALVAAILLMPVFALAAATGPGKALRRGLDREPGVGDSSLQP